ncbi:hypothetical protein CsSME_00015077 [Camellia sinensis var. sinensis]
MHRRLSCTTSRPITCSILGHLTAQQSKGHRLQSIICRFGIPKVMLSDNGTPFVNRHVGRLLSAYQIKPHKSSPYYPQGSGQAEATNKTIIRILSKMMDEAGGTWSERLPVISGRIERQRES